MISESISKLVQYGIKNDLIQEADKIYATNRILEVLQLDEFEEREISISETDLEQILKEILFERNFRLCMSKRFDRR